jgi:hypothetical protein
MLFAVAWMPLLGAGVSVTRGSPQAPAAFGKGARVFDSDPGFRFYWETAKAGRR